MSDLDIIYRALKAGQNNVTVMGNIKGGPDWADFVHDRKRVAEEGLAAYERLQARLTGTADYGHSPEPTECGCGDPDASPPCRWCSDPENEGRG